MNLWRRLGPRELRAGLRRLLEDDAERVLLLRYATRLGITARQLAEDLTVEELAEWSVWDEIDRGEG